MRENKENVPKIRFPGFTDAWEQRKLGELYTERKEPGYDSLQILSVSIHHGISNHELDSNTLGKIVRRSEDKSLYKHVYFGDLVLNMMRAWQGAIGVVKSEGMVSPAYITAIPSAELYPLFMDYYLRRDEAIIQMNNLSYGVTDFRKRLYWDSFINILCCIPSVPEQERITAFFTQLDNHIILHQRKLNNVKKLKDGLLQKMFPKDGEDFPEVRFPGFTDAWEQQRLGELAEFSKGSGYTKNDLTESGSPIVLYGRLYTKYETVINDVDTFVEMKEKSVISEGNEVVVPASGESAEDISRASVIGKSGLILGGDLNIIKLNQEIEPIFLALTISNGTQQKEMSKCAQGKSVVHLHNSELKQVNLLYPKLEEQQRIGKFFVEIDNLISLHQRKLKHLQEQKKALLQQMFV